MPARAERWTASRPRGESAARGEPLQGQPVRGRLMPVLPVPVLPVPVLPVPVLPVPVLPVPVLPGRGQAGWEEDADRDRVRTDRCGRDRPRGCPVRRRPVGEPCAPPEHDRCPGTGGGATAKGRTPGYRGCGPRPPRAVRRPPYRVLLLQYCRTSTALPDRLLADQVAQHELHDAAVAVVVRLAGGVDADDRVELDAGVGAHLHRARGGAVVELLDAGEGEGLLAGQTEGLGRDALRVLE